VIDLSQATWRKASASTGSNGACVEVTTVRLPKAGSPARGTDSVEPKALLHDIKIGRYDI
jgi:hypothetical protein